MCNYLCNYMCNYICNYTCNYMCNYLCNYTCIWIMETIFKMENNFHAFSNNIHDFTLTIELVVIEMNTSKQ